MNISLHIINGKASFIDYDRFEGQLKETLQATCSDADAVIFNAFPALVSADTRIDALITVHINPVHGNYHRFWKNGSWHYLHNLIMPVCYVDLYTESRITEDEDGDQLLQIDQEYFDFSDDNQSLKYGLINYLERRCGFNKQDLYVFPLIFVKNFNCQLLKEGLVVDTNFDFTTIINYLSKIASENVVSYQKWKSDPTGHPYLKAIQLLNDKASEDSALGYLTKKKIDRIARQLTNSRKIYDALFHRLILLEGKAGTGKSSELVSLMIKCLNERQNARFLTYNHLLVIEIAKVIKSYVQGKLEVGHTVGFHSVTTLHRFFFRLSKSLGVLLLMTEARITQLKIKLHKNITTAVKEINRLLTQYSDEIFRNNPYYSLKEFITNSKQLSVPEKEVALDLINFLKRSNLSLTVNITESINQFIVHKTSLIQSIATNQVFLSDYYNVLKNTLWAITNTSEFHSSFSIYSKLDLLDPLMGFSSRKKPDEALKSGNISEATYASRVQKVQSSIRRKSLLLVDEAQDCHRFEKDILFHVFSPNNTIASIGGKEQLIRHVELCNWTVWNSTKVPHQVVPTRRTSYRIKANPLSLCNFVAKSFHITLDLEALKTEDVGEIIIDCRPVINNQMDHLFQGLLTKGAINQCTPYESLLVLLATKGTDNANYVPTTRINEYDNIEEGSIAETARWQYEQQLGSACEYWDGTDAERRRSEIPSPGEVRLIYYESCRGLEAWSVACFDIDLFFDQKQAEPDAERYLIDDLHYSLQDRKSMFAATWVLMALTRAIDSLYIQLRSENSSFGKVIMAYAALHPLNCKILR